MDATPGTIAANAENEQFSWAFRSHPGLVRAENEDSVGAFAPEDAEERGALFVVADGMGGHAAGEVASRIAAQTLLEEWVARPTGRANQVLRGAARAANSAVFAASLDVGRRGMGTTLVALAIAGGEAHVAHVGDSRAYLVRAGQCTQLTADHSRVAEMLRMRLISAEQAARHPARSQLTRSLGFEPAVQVDLKRVEVRAGDGFVLCSDGVWDLVSSAELAETVEGQPPAKAAETIIERALERGAPDNVTVIVVRLSAEFRAAESGAGGAGASLLSRVRDRLPSLFSGG